MATRTVFQRTPEEDANLAPTKESLAILERIKKETPNQGLLVKVNITADLAHLILELNISNRPVKRPEVIKLITPMKEKEWHFTEGVISLDWNMVVTDGQKRLMAIRESGESQILHIQTGLDPKAFASIDTQRTRSSGDVVALRGYNNYNVMAAAIKGVIYYKNSRRVSDRIFNARVNPQMVDRWLDNTKNAKLMVESVTEGLRYWVQQTFIPQSTWAYVQYLLAEVDKEESKYFLGKLASGDKLDLKSPRTSAILAIRNTLIRQQSESYMSRRAYDDKIRMLFTAWNLFRQKQVVTKIPLERNPNSNELPELI